MDSTEKFLEQHYRMVRAAYAILGLILILASAPAWDLAGWSVGFTFAIVGMNLLFLGIRGAK